MFPNVNNRLYNTETGMIKECPGFWLNNTFRLICRAPHFRDQATIDRYLASNRATSSYETSLEEATQGELSGASNCHKFEFSDCMIHFGKYDDTVMKWNKDTETFTKEPYTLSLNNLKVHGAPHLWSH